MRLAQKKQSLRWYEMDNYKKILRGEISSGDAANLVDHLEEKLKELESQLSTERTRYAEQSARNCDRIKGLEKDLAAMSKEYGEFQRVVEATGPLGHYQLALDNLRSAEKAEQELSKSEQAYVKAIDELSMFSSKINELEAKITTDRDNMKAANLLAERKKEINHMQDYIEILKADVEKWKGREKSFSDMHLEEMEKVAGLENAINGYHQELKTSMLRAEKAEADNDRLKAACEEMREAVVKPRTCFLRKGDEHLWDRDDAVRANLRNEILKDFDKIAAVELAEKMAGIISCDTTT